LRVSTRREIGGRHVRGRVRTGWQCQVRRHESPSAHSRNQDCPTAGRVAMQVYVIRHYQPEDFKYHIAEAELLIMTITYPFYGLEPAAPWRHTRNPDGESGWRESCSVFARLVSARLDPQRACPRRLAGGRSPGAIATAAAERLAIRAMTAARSLATLRVVGPPMRRKEGVGWCAVCEGVRTSD
jgi:hypothetical protein